MEYADAHDTIDREVEALKGEDETDDHAFELVSVGLHALIDIAESLDSLNNHANEGRLGS